MFSPKIKTFLNPCSRNFFSSFSFWENKVIFLSIVWIAAKSQWSACKCVTITASTPFKISFTDIGNSTSGFFAVFPDIGIGAIGGANDGNSTFFDNIGSIRKVFPP